jgi:hypothetical protein
MKDKNTFLKTNLIGLALGVALLVALTGCAGYVDGPRAGAYAAPPVVETTFAVQDDYVYYPQYEIYYSSSRHEYASREGNAWISRPEPRGFSVNAVQASPSVRMDFHDSPANHHAAVAKQYPKNWKPSGPNQGQKQKDDQRGDNNGR